MNNSIITSFIVALFVPTISLAAPADINVSGTISHGESVTITGSGFGTKATVAPILWDTVENRSTYSGLSNGATIPVGGSNPWGENEGVKLSTTESRTGGKCYKSTGIKGALGGRDIGSSPAAVYVSWWWKPSASVTDGDHSSKFIRLSGPDLVNQTFSWTQAQDYVYDSGYVVERYVTYPGVVNQWNFHEVWFNNTSKTYSVRVNGVTTANNVPWASGTFQFDYLWKLGWDGGGNNPPSITTWMDDIYVDNTPQRVTMCTGATWANAGPCEVQVPTAWGTSLISAEVNQGALADEDTAYLYVVDSSGNANASGYQVTIGGGAPAQAAGGRLSGSLSGGGVMR